MSNFYGLAQTPTGSELIEVLQLQNGNWAKCNMPISEIPQTSTLTIANLTSLIASLPKTMPASSGILWLNGGVLSVS